MHLGKQNHTYRYNMKQKEFEKLLDRRIELIRSVLSKKGKEYSSDLDRLHNFKRAGKMLQCSPEKALIGMWTKHIISILDIVDELDYKCGMEKDCYPAFDVNRHMAMVEEKIGDSINYLILLEALIKERNENILSCT